MDKFGVRSEIAGGDVGAKRVDSSGDVSGLEPEKRVRLKKFLALFQVGEGISRHAADARARTCQEPDNSFLGEIRQIFVP
jgi:hypothetical protein